jgi:hypothetical protein
MAYTSRVLVISRQTADSDDLLHALKQRAERGPISVMLLLPAPEAGSAGRDAGRQKLDDALEKLRAAGLEADGVVGPSDPLDALLELWKPGAYDEIVVATLPGASSAWLRHDFPHRVAQITDCQVTHVIARPPGWAEHPAGPPPAQEKSPLGPLGVLSWGGRHSAP